MLTIILPITYFHAPSARTKAFFHSSLRSHTHYHLLNKEYYDLYSLGMEHPIHSLGMEHTHLVYTYLFEARHLYVQVNKACEIVQFTPFKKFH